jgi:hypothetical protein
MITKVAWKNEGHYNETPIGPVALIDQDRLDQDPVVIERKLTDEPGLPYGYTPQGMVRLSIWLPRADAVAIAEISGAEFEEH